jgi:hypothetical protein
MNERPENIRDRKKIFCCKGVWSHKPLRSSGFSAINTTNVHQTRFYIPFGGKFIKIRLSYYNDSLIPMTIDTGWAGIASGNNFNELNPKKPDGTASTWIASINATQVAGTMDTKNPTVGYSDWFTVYVYPDIDNSAWGTVYLRAKASSGGRSHGFNNQADAIAWNKNYPNMKSIASYGNITSISDDFGPNAQTDQPYRIAYPSIYTMGKKYSVAWFGDSRSDASYASGEYIHNHWRNLLSKSYPQISHQHYAFSGDSARVFLNRAITYLNSSADKPDAIIIQVSSSNDTNPYTEATIQADIDLVTIIVNLCKSQGIKLITIIGYAYQSGNTVDKVSWWKYANITPPTKHLNNQAA